MISYDLIDAQPEHFDQVLALNHEFVEYLSPLDAASLAELAGVASYFKVVTSGNTVLAFLIALYPGAAYDSPNYVWFDERFKAFAYIDRIVVSPKGRGLSLGSKLYDDLVDTAKGFGLKQLTCEYNVKPMNEGSAKFHRRFGFKEIDQQLLATGKTVSMQVFGFGE